jgi:hypothetical protein
MLSFIGVQGTKRKPLLVHDCTFIGPTTKAGTHVIADRGCEWLEVRECKSRKAKPNFAMAIAGGSHNYFHDNDIISEHGGIYIRNYYAHDPFAGNRAKGNKITAPQPYWIPTKKGTK